MAEAILLKSGGGVTSDDVTALRENILDGYSTIAKDSDDEVVLGTMPNNGNLEKTLDAGQVFTIPKGYHGGVGKITATGLTPQTQATATENKILTGETAWVNGIKITGNIGIMNGGTYHASSKKQTIPCQGKYMSNNIIIDATNVTSILSFSSASNYQKCTLTWKNPSKGAFNGIVVRGRRDTYPTSPTDGQEVYKGYGNNTQPNGISQASFYLSTGRWYFSAFSYCNIDNIPVYNNSKIYKDNDYFSCDHCGCYSDCDCQGDCGCRTWDGCPKEGPGPGCPTKNA